MNKLLIVLGLTLTLGSFAQKLSDDFSVTTMEPYEVIDAGAKNYISLNNGYVLAVKMGRGVLNVQKMDVNEMKEVARSTYENLPKGAFFQDVVQLQDKIYVIYEVKDRRAKKHTVYAQEINSETAEFKPEKILFETSRLVEYTVRPVDLSKMNTAFTTRPKFTIYKSFDDSKMMIQYRLKTLKNNDKKNIDEMGFMVYDKDLTEVGVNEVKMPYTEAVMNNVSYSVGSNGDCKMILAHRENKTYEALTVKKTGETEVKDLGISTDQMVRSLRMMEDNEGDFTCVGYYANGIEYKFGMGGGALAFNVNGLLYFKIDKNNSVDIVKEIEFPLEFIQQNLNERQQKGLEKREQDDKAGILDLQMTYFTIKADGSAIVYGERQYEREEYWMGPQRKRVFHFGNIVGMKVDSNGELVWLKKLPKNQAGIKGCGQMSIAVLEGPENDYVAYVDNPKNIELDADGGVPESHKDGMGGFLTTYKINHLTGDLEKHTLCDVHKINDYKAYQFNTWRILKSQEGMFLMEVYIKNKKDTMVKFEMN